MVISIIVVIQIPETHIIIMIIMVIMTILPIEIIAECTIFQSISGRGSVCLSFTGSSALSSRSPAER